MSKRKTAKMTEMTDDYICSSKVAAEFLQTREDLLIRWCHTKPYNAPKHTISADGKTITFRLGDLKTWKLDKEAVGEAVIQTADADGHVRIRYFVQGKRAASEVAYRKAHPEKFTRKAETADDIRARNRARGQANIRALEKQKEATAAPAKEMPFRNLLVTMIDDSDHTAKTKRELVKVVDAFPAELREMGLHEVAELSPNSPLWRFEKSTGRVWRPATIEEYLRRVSRLMHAAVSRGLLSRNPLAAKFGHRRIVRPFVSSGPRILQPHLSDLGAPIEQVEPQSYARAPMGPGVPSKAGGWREALKARMDALIETMRVAAAKLIEEG